MPNDLSKEERERLRELTVQWSAAAAFQISGQTLLALLDAADERDRLAREVERLKSSPHPALVRITSLQEQCSHQATRIAELQAVVESKKNFHRCTDRIQPWPGRFCSVTPHSPEADFDPVERIAELEKTLRDVLPIINAVRMNKANEISYGERCELDFQKNKIDEALDKAGKA